jgi:hypothetical protein
MEIQEQLNKALLQCQQLEQASSAASEEVIASLV